MAVLSNLVVELNLDSNGLIRGLEGTKSKLSSFSSDFKKYGTVASAALTLPILVGAGKAISAASDLNEAVSATNTIYGKSAKGIEKWATTTADAYGISNEAALTAVDTLGQLYKGVGLSTDQAAKFSVATVQAAGDLASFYNVDPGQALADLQSGLVGEYEPLRKYGIVLSEAAVQQQAMADTGKTNAKQLTESEKVTARQELITKGLGAAQGDAARTADGLANSIRRLKARAIDLAAEFGKVLLPMALKLVSGLLSIVGGLQGLSPHMEKIIIIVAALAASIGPLLLVLGFALDAFLLLVSPIGLLVAGFVLLATKTDLLQRAFHFVVDAITPFIAAMKAAFDSGVGIKNLVEFLPPGLEKLERGFLLIADAMGDVYAAYQSGGFRHMLDVLPDEIGQALDGVLSLVKGLGSIAVNFVIDTAVSIAGWLWDHKGDIWGGIKDAVGWTVDTFTQAITTTIDGALALGGDLLKWAGNLWGWIKSKLFGGASDSATSGEVSVGDQVIDIGNIAINAALSWAASVDWAGLVTAAGTAITAAFTAATDFVSPIATAIWDKFTSFGWTSTITTDSFGAGSNFGAAVHDAIASGISAAVGAITNADISSDDVLTAVEAIGGAIGTAAIAAPAATLALSTAIASFIAGAITGLVFGDDADFSSVATKIQAAVMASIDESTGWELMLLIKGEDLVAGLITGLKTKWSDVQDWLHTRDDQVVTSIGDLTQTLLQKGVDLIQGLSDGAAQLWENFNTWLGSRDEAVVSAIGDLSQTLYTTGSQLLEGLWQGAGDEWDSITDWLSGLGADAVSWIGDLSGTLYSVGVSLLAGMANGITDSAYLVSNAVGAIVGAIPAAVRSLLGISSPSKVMTDLLYAVPQGMAKGMLAGQPLVLAAANRLGSTIPDSSGNWGMAGSSVYGGDGGSSGGGTSHSWGGITINVTGNGDPRATADEVFAVFAREMQLRSAS